MGTIDFQHSIIADDVIASGSVSSIGPRCRAFLSASQLNLTDNVWTLIQLDAETYDSDNIFNTGTYKCIPTVEGFYLVIAQLQFKATSILDGKYIYAGIFKNNVLAAQDLRVTASAVKGHAVGVCDIIYCNGTTDFITMKAKHWNGNNFPDVNGGTEYTYMCVCKQL